ncbi:MAG: DUF2806 domain-containing protein, partial [Clostridia bacterium]|nr:DUF2806 domain-containing protein [Clostridia bacterium]
MGEGAEIAKALVSPANKLIDCISGALGRIFEPIHIKRMAKANAFALKTMQEAIDSNPELAQAYDSGLIQIDNKELNGLTVRSIERSLYQEMVKQQNLESVVAKTYGLLENEPDVPDTPVEQDWMARFVNSVETISDDDMQLLWAKVLAGEIKKPKTYSLRTLESLKNLSKEEAILFQRLCKYVITKDDCSYFVNEEELWDKNELNMGRILQLSDCGIVNDSSLIDITYTFQPNSQDIFFNDEIIIVCTNKEAQPRSFSFRVFPLTAFGCNLISIINKYTSNEFLLEFAKYLKKIFTNIEVKAHQIITKSETNITFKKKIDLI